MLPSYTVWNALLILTSWLLALSYLVGGYWLFNPNPKKNKAIPILAGIAFATSIFTLPLIIRASNESFLKVLPWVNGIFFIGLSTYLAVNWNSKNIFKRHKSVFFRSAIILIVVGFFSLQPVSFKPYRSIMIALNNGNTYLINNVKMHNYVDNYEDALDKGNCDRAIVNAENAIKAGKKWLGFAPKIDSGFPQELPFGTEEYTMALESDNPTDKGQLLKISGTFGFLYNAYKCKADNYYENGNYEEALRYYWKADNVLNSCDYHYDVWYVDQAYSLKDIAVCYEALSNYKYADSFHIESIIKYEEVTDTIDYNTAVLYTNLAESLSDQNLFEYSNQILKASIEILEKDSIKDQNKKKIVDNHITLAKNNLNAGMLDEAEYYLGEAFKRVDQKTVDFCHTNLYFGVYHLRLCNYRQSDEIFSECLACYQKFLEPTHQNIAETHLALARVKKALAEYNSVKVNLDKSIEITTGNYGKNSVRHANHLIEYANLEKMLGNYKKAEQKYHRVLDIFTQKLGEIDPRVSGVLSELADVEIDLAKFGKAKGHSDNSMSIASHFMELENPLYASIINNAAYVNYYLGLYGLSDSLYRKTIQINEDFGLESTASTAVAINGLGLIMKARGEYTQSDSLFSNALMAHKEIFGENHPLTAVVYLNHANLKVEQNRLEEAQAMFTKSLDINKVFFDPDHDTFADTYLGLGELAEKEGNQTTAKEYYQKALEIYLKKFDYGHQRVISTMNKLGK